MTKNQIAYQNLRELGRSNLARETETHRSNVVNELENERSHRAQETETGRANRAREELTSQSNLEQARTNRAKEEIEKQKITSNERISENTLRNSSNIASADRASREKMGYAQLESQSDIASRNREIETAKLAETKRQAYNKEGLAERQFQEQQGMNRVDTAVKASQMAQGEARAASDVVKALIPFSQLFK